MTAFRPMTEIENPTLPPPNEIAPEQPDEEINSPTWEDDETSATFVLRALSTLLCGAFLAWAQYNAGINSTVAWTRWIQLSVVANLLFPLGIIWFFFGQGIVHLDWLK